ncbi:MAG TPA: ScpA family protein [Stellaceae bacterium]|nr:ScpA family protein [Stellaceae bacterium]
MTDATDFFEQDPPPAGGEPTELVVDLGSYEGPIDVLLTLAREQKVDLTRISILRLADQYLAFIAAARRLRLEIAADYLVMAAWLAYLKSRLLLPEPAKDDEPTGPELAEALAHQLQRLEAMQRAGARLMALPQLGRDVFARGTPEGIPVVRRTVYDATLFELLKAYGDGRARAASSVLHIEPAELYSVDDALQRLSRFLGRMPEWRMMASFLPPDLRFGLIQRSAIAATFVASLELVREGRLQLRQDKLFGPIYLRSPPLTEAT